MSTDFLNNLGKLFEGGFSGAPNQTLFGSNSIIESGFSTKLLQRDLDLLSERNRLTTSNNLQLAEQQRIALGQASIDLSTSLNQLADAQRQQIAIREQQRAEDNAFTKEINERLSTQVTDLGKTSIDLSKAGSGGDFWQDLRDKLGFTGLLVGGAVLLILVLKR